MQSDEELVEKRIEGKIAAEPQTQATAITSPSIDDNAKVEEQWGDGTTIIEEEPWPGDLQGTWPGYVSSI